MPLETVLFIVVMVATGGHMVSNGEHSGLRPQGSVKQCIENVKASFEYAKRPTEELAQLIEECHEDTPQIADSVN